MKTKLIVAIAFCLCVLTLNAQQVYVLNSKSQLEPAVKSVTTGMKVSGKAMLSAFGSKLTSSVEIDGKNSNLILPQGATYFYIISPIHVPIESWKMAPLKEKKKKRELPYSKTGLYSGTSTEIDEIPLRVEQLTDEIYKVVPTDYLGAGEYALFRIEAGVPAEVYDFRVDPSLPSHLDVPQNKEVASLLRSKESNSPIKYAENPSSDKIVGARQLNSDVDINIPKAKKDAENTIVLIIANENYENGIKKVDYALNDGAAFEQYMKLAVGVPESQIITVTDGTLGKMKGAFTRLKQGAQVIGKKSKIVVYYSGHGIPDETTKEAYILPVDYQVGDNSTGFKLKDIYTDLGAIDANSVVFFIDGCFSGATRTDDDDMIVSARSVAIKAKEEKPTGNLVVFSAAQGDQTAHTYKEKSHGLMTYFLLKKLQETNGDATLGELAEYITENVKKSAFFINNNQQLPAVTSAANNKLWQKMTLK
ncbi:MAG: caspase family protein [Muribaculaceae bacterium]|nr:caspase family protein [Muribaculaceae bacterium]